MNKLNKLNLGCGSDIKEGYINLDNAKIKGVDIVWDIDKIPMPFEDNTFKEIYASHILEHSKDFLKLLGELNRISKPKAKIIIRVPVFPSMYSASDPTHKQFFTYHTFSYLEEGGLSELSCYKDLEGMKFKILKRRIDLTGHPKLSFVNSIVNLFPKFYTRFLSSVIPAYQLYVELEVNKRRQNGN